MAREALAETDAAAVRVPLSPAPLLDDTCSMTPRLHRTNSGARLAVMALTLVVLVTGSGCAFGTRHVDLTYTDDLLRPASASLDRTVAVARFSDGRSPKEGTERLLGKVRNAYGIPTASVVANQDPLLWVNEGIVRGLEREGFTVEKVERAEDAGTLPTVSGTVTRASGGMYMSMDANIEADVAIQAGGRQLMSSICSGRASKVAWTASTSEYRTVFGQAMDAFIADCIPKLRPALLTDGQ